MTDHLRAAIRRADRIVRAWQDCRQAFRDVRGSAEYSSLRSARRRLGAELRRHPPVRRRLTGAQALVALDANRKDPYADPYTSEDDST